MLRVTTTTTIHTSTQLPPNHYNIQILPKMQGKLFFLPRNIAELQLASIDLVLAMYPDEVEIPLSTREFLDHYRSCTEDSLEFTLLPPSAISFTIHFAVDDLHSIPFHVSFPFQSFDPEPLEPPPMTYSLRQPQWLSKANLTHLVTSMPRDDIHEAFEYIQESALKLLKTTITSSNSSKEPYVRAWFYFPSLSTREKRDDLVNQAPGFNLTGFVLAGKPAVLALEGRALDVDNYMKYIKTQSWRDIPSHQKKVSEKFREEGIERVFNGMEEITDEWQRGGQKANRSDMKAFEGWLKDKGLGYVFEKIIF